MTKKRGRSHTTLTETAAAVVSEIKKMPGVDMIAPGEIDPRNRSSSSTKYITVAHTNAGCSLIISGQGSQRVAIHTDDSNALVEALRNNKKLKAFVIKEREHKPEI
jgi:hypothetical protein